MEILGIGPLEMVAILIVIFVVMGPSDMVKMGNTVGRAIRRFRGSGLWLSFRQATRQLRELPETLAREVAGTEVDDLRREIKDEIQEHKGQLDELNEQLVAWTRQPEAQSQKKQPALEDAPKTNNTDAQES